MIRILSEILVTLSESPVVSLVAKGTVVLALGLVSAWFARRSRAAVRHAFLASTFGVLLALPIVSFLATPVSIPVPVAKDDSNIWPLFDDTAVPSSGQPEARGSSAAAAKSGWALPPLSTMLLCGWFLGTAFFMIPMVGGVLQIRSLRRFGLPWRHGQAVAGDLTPNARRHAEVLLHESMPGPMTCGVLNPVIILPVDAQSWDKQDLERALVHELEHVRRYDWAIHCLARLACAAYWFHPLVWIAWRQLALEAERSCDDAVLRSSEATVYADQLVELARRRSGARKSPALAMANRSDLSARVGAVLDNRQARGRAGVFLVALACTAAAVVLTVSPLRMVAAPQSPPAQFSVAIPLAPPPPPFSAARASGPTCAVVSAADARSEFEAVSVKPAGAVIRGGMGGVSGGPGSGDPGRVTMPRMPLSLLVMLAYDLKRDQLSGPTWIGDGLNDGFAIAATMSKTTTKEQYCGMLRNLLTERFHLELHHEARSFPGYELTVAKGGSKLKRFTGSTNPSEISEPTPLNGRSGGFPKLPPSGLRGSLITMSPPGVMKMSYRGPLGPFATGLGPFVGWSTGSTGPGSLDPRIVDKTGLDGVYEIHLAFAGTLAGVPGADSSAAPAAVETAPNIVDAVTQQLGLKLQKAKAVSVEVFIIDHVDRKPTNN